MFIELGTAYRQQRNGTYARKKQTAHIAWPEILHRCHPTAMQNFRPLGYASAEHGLMVGIQYKALTVYPYVDVLGRNGLQIAGQVKLDSGALQAVA